MSRLAPPSSASLEYREIVRSCRGPAIYRHHRSGCRRIPPRPPQRGPPAVASPASAGPRVAHRARPASIAMQRRRPMSTSTASSRPAAAGSARSPAPGPGPAPRAGTSATRSAGRWPRSSSLMCSSATRASRTRRHGLPPRFSVARRAGDTTGGLPSQRSDATEESMDERTRRNRTPWRRKSGSARRRRSSQTRSSSRPFLAAVR